MSDDAVRIVLPDGTPVWARVSGAEQLQGGGGTYTDTGFGSRVIARVESLRGLVTGVAASLADALHAARPDEVSVQFGIELTGKEGVIVGMLAGGEAKGAINVTLTWRDGPPQALATAPDERAAPGALGIPGPAPAPDGGAGGAG